MHMHNDAYMASLKDLLQQRKYFAQNVIFFRIFTVPKINFSGSSIFDY